MDVENENGEAATPESSGSENTAVEMMSDAGPVTAADLEAQLLADDEADETSNSDEENEDAASNDETDDVNADADEDDDSTSEEKEEDDDSEDKDSLTPEQQAVFDKRIGKEVGKRKTLEEDLEKERAETARLQDELETLTTQYEEAAPQIPQGTHPLLVVENEADIDAWEEKFWEFKNWARRHKEGYEGEDDRGNTVTYSAEDIAARMDDLTEEKERFLPKARDGLRKRAEYDLKVKEIYPELLERKTSAYREMLAVLKAVPAIKQLPDYKLVVGDILAGRKVRSGKPAETESVENKEEKSKEKTKVKLKKQPPKVPVRNAPGKAPSASASPAQTTSTGINTKRLVDMGGSMDALEELIYQSG